MNSVEEAIQAMLKLDSGTESASSLAALGLSVYPRGGRGLAVFVQEPIPGDCPRPYIAIPPAISAQPSDSKTRHGGQWYIDIGVYCDNKGSVTLVNALALRVFHLARFQFLYQWKHPDLDLVICRPNWPVSAPTDNTLIGRLVSVEIMAQAKQ